jgi:hypothetical protein
MERAIRDMARVTPLVGAQYAYEAIRSFMPRQGETQAPHPMEKLTALEASVYGALKWLLSHDPLNSMRARDILLSAVGQTQEEFAHRYRDHIIQPPAVKTPAEGSL